MYRLLGIVGLDEYGVPLPNVVVDTLKEKAVMVHGVLFYLCNAIVEKGLSPQMIAHEKAAGNLDLTKLTIHDDAHIHAAFQPYINESIERIFKRREHRLALEDSIHF